MKESINRPGDEQAPGLSPGPTSAFDHADYSIVVKL